MADRPRWRAIVHYRSEAGLVDVMWDIEEIEDLHDLIEGGPSFRTIDRIVIVYADNPEPGLTVEKAETQ